MSSKGKSKGRTAARRNPATVPDVEQQIIGMVILFFQRFEDLRREHVAAHLKAVGGEDVALSYESEKKHSPGVLLNLPRASDEELHAFTQEQIVPMWLDLSHYGTEFTADFCSTLATSLAEIKPAPAKAASVTVPVHRVWLGFVHAVTAVIYMVAERTRSRSFVNETFRVIRDATNAAFETKAAAGAPREDDLEIGQMVHRLRKGNVKENRKPQTWTQVTRSLRRVLPMNGKHQTPSF
jgi:hypothetical protein